MKTPAYKFYELTWDQVLSGYSTGIFPMGDSDGSISWYESSPRAIIPIDLPISKVHIPRSLSMFLKKNPFSIKIDTEFDSVIKSCADRENTWINSLIIKAYNDLFRLGYAHSVEAWDNNELVGGLYGVAYRGAFFGESMFYKKSNASKAALVKLYDILKANNYLLFDIQMMTPLFETFGAVSISKKGYHSILERAMRVKRKFVY